MSENISRCPHITDEEIVKLSESELADLFSEVSNASGMLMHLVCEDQNYESELQSYDNLYIRLKNRILEILKVESVYADIDSLPYHYVVLPFMERYGYKDGNGWWIKPD